MSKGKPCTLIVNTRWGYTFSPVKCNSIAEARRRGKEWFGFAYRIFVEDENGNVVKTLRGFCDD